MREIEECSECISGELVHKSAREPHVLECTDDVCGYSERKAQDLHFLHEAVRKAKVEGRVRTKSRNSSQEKF